MNRVLAIFAAGAVLQVAIPAQAASPVMIALCGGGAPIQLPMKNDGSGQTCCKICHSARRERGEADSCCSKDTPDEED